MGLHDSSTIEGYFSQQWENKMPFFTDVFRRKRFLQIFWMLHAGQIDTTMQVRTTRLNKI